ncbi:hypothetical protein VTJ49DRAFT_4530 [Mycothermus thermophilus]|uniref:Ergot alkaloid biosynthetic protein A n=1 Tax=Humicola insolens TaxID=85995 RepID=A0ABR3V544_HUMIN
MSSSPSSPTSILVLGGTGTIGRRLIRKLTSSFYSSSSFSDSDTPPPTILIASPSHDLHHDSNDPTNNQRHAFSNTSNIHHVLFDWDDPTTWENPFAYNAPSSSTSSPPLTPHDLPQPRWPPVRAVYLASPLASLHAADEAMTHFVTLARERGARRFVLQRAFSSSLPLPGVEPGGGGGGGGGGGERAKNFATLPAYVRAIRDESKIYSATGDGRIPWVSADDVAAVAARALTDPEPPNTEYLVLGPELLSYGEIAHILTETLGRRVVHVTLHAPELERRYRAFGMPEDYARLLGAMETAVKFGAEERTNDAVLAMTGAAPRRFRDFARSVREVWEGRVEPEGEGWF